MLRESIDPRPDWRDRVEEQGLFFHSVGGTPYWDESACYTLEASQIEQIETATADLNEKCLGVVQHLVDNATETFPTLGIPENYWEFILRSWEEDEHTIYGRFDFAFDGVSPPKMLEYNADTPTSLLEAGVIQWYWLQDIGGRFDQFNSIHERLIEAFKRVKDDREIAVPFYFTSLGQDDSVEDYMTATYLRDCAVQAGLDARYINVQDIGLGDSNYFLDGGDDIAHLFKLYPWEWLFAEEFGKNIPESETEFYEPAWKVLLSSKGMLPYLYQLYGDSPYVLKASFSQEDFGDTWVRKPIDSREGQNVLICKNNSILADTPGDYGESPVVFQEYSALPMFAGNCPVIGSWMVNGYACGMGIRESTSIVTDNTSRFIPHRFIPAAKTGGFGAMRKRLLGK